MNAELISRGNNNGIVSQLTHNIVRRVLEELTFHHDQIEIWNEAMGRVQVILVRVSKADMPRIIGSQGKHRHALFNLVEQIGLRHSEQIRLEYMEPNPGMVTKFAPFQASPQWESRPVVQLVRDILSMVFLYETEVTLVDSRHTPTSTIEVVVSDQEHMQTVARVTECLKVLFNAIGKRHGRILLVDMISQRVKQQQRQGGEG